MHYLAHGSLKGATSGFALHRRTSINSSLDQHFAGHMHVKLELPLKWERNLVQPGGD